MSTFVLDYRHGSYICTLCGAEVQNFLMTISSYNDFQRTSTLNEVVENRTVVINNYNNCNNSNNNNCNNKEQEIVIKNHKYYDSNNNNIASCNSLKNDEVVSSNIVKVSSQLPEEILHLFDYLIECYHLSSCSAISKDAVFFYNLYLVHIHRKMICSKEIVTSAVFCLACKRNGFKYPFKEITLLFVSNGNLQEQHVFTKKTSLLFHLIEEKEGKMNNVVMVQSDTPEVDLSVLKASFTKFDLTFSKEKKIKEIYVKLFTEESIPGINPLTITAIALYLGLKKDEHNNDRALIQEISKKICLSITTIKKAYKYVSKLYNSN